MATCVMNGTRGVCASADGDSCQCVTDDFGCSIATGTCGGRCLANGQRGTCQSPGRGQCNCYSDEPGDGGLLFPSDQDAGVGKQADASVEAPDAATATVVELPVHGQPLVSLYADMHDEGAGTIYGVDGVSSWLYRFDVASNPPTLTPAPPVQLPEPGLRVLIVHVIVDGISDSVPAVVGRSGRIYVGWGPTFDIYRVPLGITSVAPLLRASCETPPVTVSAGEIGATVVVPTAEGPAAFLEGVPQARFVDTVTFDRDGGLPLAYFTSGGIIGPYDGGVPAGFLVSQTATQIYDLAADGGLPKKAEFHFSARSSTAVYASAKSATLVVGGPEGLHFVPLSAGSLPAESAATHEPSCLDVRKLASLGDGSSRVVALAHLAWAGGAVRQTLCLANASTGKVDVSVVTFPIASIATADTLEHQKVAHHLFTAGWEGAAGAPPTLVIHHATVSGPSDDPIGGLAPLVWGSSATQLLPTGGAPIAAMATSPDGRRLLVAFAGEHPGLLSIDPWPFLNAGSEADRAAALTTISLSAAPVGIGFSADGALAVVALADDTLAYVR